MAPNCLENYKGNEQCYASTLESQLSVRFGLQFLLFQIMENLTKRIKKTLSLKKTSNKVFWGPPQHIVCRSFITMGVAFWILWTSKLCKCNPLTPKRSGTTLRSNVPHVRPTSVHESQPSVSFLLRWPIFLIVTCTICDFVIDYNVKFKISVNLVIIKTYKTSN